MVHWDASPFIHILIVENMVTMTAKKQRNTNNMSVMCTYSLFIQLFSCLQLKMITVERVLLMCAPEGSPLHILPTKAHMDALFEQRAESHVLSQCPVHGPVFDHVTTTFQNTTQTCT